MCGLTTSWAVSTDLRVRGSARERELIFVDESCCGRRHDEVGDQREGWRARVGRGVRSDPSKGSLGDLDGDNRR
jgi:hypothetical protein